MVLGPLSGRLSAEAPLQEAFDTENGGQEFSVAEARSRLLAAADTYRDVPYRYGGTDRLGLDCSGLVNLSFRDALGVSVPRRARDLRRWTERIADDEISPGDLVFFNTTGAASHVGIYVGDGAFIHAASRGPRRGVIYSRLDEAYWRRTYAGAGRALPIEDEPPEQDTETVFY